MGNVRDVRAVDDVCMTERIISVMAGASIQDVYRPLTLTTVYGWSIASSVAGKLVVAVCNPMLPFSKSDQRITTFCGCGGPANTGPLSLPIILHENRWLELVVTNLDYLDNADFYVTIYAKID